MFRRVKTEIVKLNFSRKKIGTHKKIKYTLKTDKIQIFHLSLNIRKKLYNNTINIKK